MPKKVRINLANADELLELGLERPQAASIVRYRAEHGPIKDSAQLATILGGHSLSDTVKERADFAPADATAPEAPGA
jgi:DNA uptake protein ComE-like DNA-binding protein